MKIITLDEYEFENTGSEEFLVIAVAKSNQYANLNAFFEVTAKNEEFELKTEPDWGNKIPFKNYRHSSITRQYLNRFIGKAPSSFAKVVVIHEEWNMQDILVEESGAFIRYYWSTSA